jgi:hypothetical protein
MIAPKALSSIPLKQKQRIKQNQGYKLHRLLNESQMDQKNLERHNLQKHLRFNMAKQLVMAYTRQERNRPRERERKCNIKGLYIYRL